MYIVRLAEAPVPQPRNQLQPTFLVLSAQLSAVVTVFRGYQFISLRSPGCLGDSPSSVPIFAVVVAWPIRHAAFSACGVSGTSCQRHSRPREHRTRTSHLLARVYIANIYRHPFRRAWPCTWTTWADDPQLRVKEGLAILNSLVGTSLGPLAIWAPSPPRDSAVR